jgi:hypothetical protein
VRVHARLPRRAGSAAAQQRQVARGYGALVDHLARRCSTPAARQHRGARLPPIAARAALVIVPLALLRAGVPRDRDARDRRGRQGAPALPRRWAGGPYADRLAGVAPVAGTLFFAGEATDAAGMNATTAGALASAERACAEITARGR